MNINNSVITDEEKIEEIRAHLISLENDFVLCKKKSEFIGNKGLYLYLNEQEEENGVHMLSNPPPLRGEYFYDY